MRRGRQRSSGNGERRAYDPAARRPQADVEGRAQGNGERSSGNGGGSRRGPGQGGGNRSRRPERAGV